MSEVIVPVEIARFISEKIESVAQLEALLLMRSNSNEKWTVRALAARLYITEQQATEIFVRLWTHGFVAHETGDPPRYYYHPSPMEIWQKVDRLAEIYSRHFLAVTNLIHSRPKTRVQRFADVFKIRKDD
jgi:hypothetical protein